jgi:hypothetical protein
LSGTYCAWQRPPSTLPTTSHVCWIFLYELYRDARIHKHQTLSVCGLTSTFTITFNKHFLWVWKV